MIETGSGRTDGSFYNKGRLREGWRTAHQIKGGFVPEERTKKRRGLRMTTSLDPDGDGNGNTWSTEWRRGLKNKKVFQAVMLPCYLGPPIYM